MQVQIKSRIYELKRYKDLNPYSNCGIYAIVYHNDFKDSDWIAIDGIGSTFYPIICNSKFCIGKPFSVADKSLQIGRDLDDEDVKYLQKFIIRRKRFNILNWMFIVFLFIIFCLCIGLVGAVTKDTTSTPVLFLSICFIADVCFLLLKS